MVDGWEPIFTESTDTEALDALSTESRQAVTAMAVDFLRGWTGAMFGTHTLTVRPCVQRCQSGTWAGDAVAGRYLIGYNCFQCRPGGCTCDGGSRSIRLPGPVQAVRSVTLAGVPFLGWSLHHGLLSRDDGEGWPTCQDVTAPVAAFEVVYVKGLPVPYGGRVAAGVLAAELAKALANDSSCALPQRVQSITRQGVTMAILDQFDDLNRGRTGIWAIDSWVSSVTQPRQGGRVLSPDIRR